MPDKAQLGLEATYRLYETARGWVFLAAQFDDEFAALCRVIGREDLLGDSRYASWAARIRHREELGAELEAVFKTRDADEWETLLIAADIGCVRADGPGHVRFLHEDPHTQAIGFMTPTRSRAFLDRAPEGKYWRHAPPVKFSETPCEAGKPYEEFGVHTRSVLEELGYDDATIERLEARKVIGIGRYEEPPAAAVG